MREGEGNLRLSVVSHGQQALLAHLLQDLRKLPENVQISITANCPGSLPAHLLLDQRLDVTENTQPAGFGANHNAVFQRSTASFFGVINPDLRMPTDPFPALLDALKQPDVGVVAPLVRSPSGEVEDNARNFPRFHDLVAKALGAADGRAPVSGTDPQAVDWVGGMCMLFRQEAFASIGGFDEGFHLYYEDVDICARLWRAGWKVVLVPQAEVIHDAQRTSRRNLGYMRWHALSIARYFFKHLGRLP